MKKPIILYFLLRLYKRMNDSGNTTDNLSGSQQFMLISGGIATAGACLGMILQFVLKSRCVTIRCCGLQCDRSVVELQAADLEINTT